MGNINSVLLISRLKVNIKLVLSMKVCVTKSGVNIILIEWAIDNILKNYLIFKNILFIIWWGIYRELVMKFGFRLF